MPWVRFEKDFDWNVHEKCVFAYKAGKTYLVRRICADKAVKEGKAVYVERPKKKLCQPVI